jgi:hypothetical protein
MLMSPYNSGVDHHVFVVVIAGQRVEDAWKNSTLRPPAEALVNDFPVTEPLWQIASGNAGAIAIENSFNEQSIVRGRAADMAFAARKKVIDPIPLVISQCIAPHPVSPS